MPASPRSGFLIGPPVRRIPASDPYVSVVKHVKSSVVRQNGLEYAGDLRLDGRMRSRLTLVSLAVVLLVELPGARQPSPDGLRKDVDALLAGMVAAFKRDPATVGVFYNDAAAIVGPGQRYQGRATIDNYWKNAAGFADWSLDTLDTGGHADAPWAYGRSVLLSKSGKKMETYFVGLTFAHKSRRTSSGPVW